MFKRYILIGIAGCALTVLAAGVINWFIDPYGIFGTRIVHGLNALKPFAGDRGRTVKLYQVIRVRPRGLIVGNSRPELGLDPANGCWPKSTHPI